MAVRIGDNGGIRVAPEAAYGTAGTVFAWQHARTASKAPKRTLLPPGQLGASNPATRRYGVPFADGEIGVAWNNSRAVTGPLLAAAGNLATNDYTIGDLSVAPDNNIGLTTWIDYGGYAVRFLGGRLSVMRWEIQPDAPVIFTCGLLSQSFSNQTVVTPAAPAESGIVYESDLSGFTAMGADLGQQSATIEVQLPLVGSGRHLLGAGMIQPPVYSGRATVKLTFNSELSNDAGMNTEALLALFMSGTVVGDVQVGHFLISGCYMDGDWPTLGEGVTQTPITLTGQDVVITTTA